MRFSSSLTTMALSATLATAAPFQFPLANGFPSLNSTALAAVQKMAGGTLPNGPLPAYPGKTGVAALQLIAFNEIFEVAYFSSLLANITEAVPGYEGSMNGLGRKYLIEALTAIVAQEQLHATDANGALTAFASMDGNVQPIKPCQYMFPVDNLEDSIALAATFTDLVLGTLQGAQELFLNSSTLVGLVGSIIGQEGEQEGGFRIFQGKRPSSSPFLTMGQADFAYSALMQNFVVPGSCPNANTIPFTVFPPLKVLNNYIPSRNTTLSYQIQPTSLATISSSSCVAYITGQDVPVVVPVTNIQKTGDGSIIFDAELPFDEGFSNGLTIAAVVSSAGPFADANAVAAKTLFGPGLLEIS